MCARRHRFFTVLSRVLRIGDGARRARTTGSPPETRQGLVSYSERMSLRAAGSRVSGVAAVVVALLAAESGLNAQSSFRPFPYVEIDAHVVDGQGRPVRDLRKEDFTLQENGTA